MTVAIVWVVSRADQERFVMVSYSMMFPMWHRLSIAYPAIPQVESEPVQVPIAIGSAVCHTCVMWCVDGCRVEQWEWVYKNKNKTGRGVRETAGASAAPPCVHLEAQTSRREHQT